MNYAVVLLEKGLKDVIDTRGYIVAHTFPSPITDELIKIDYQIETIKNAIEFLKFNTRRTETQLYIEIANKHNITKERVRFVVTEPKKYGK